MRPDDANGPGAAVETRLLLEATARWILGAVVALAGLGVVLVYSSSALRAEQLGCWSLYFVERQLQWIALGLVALGAAALFDYRWLARIRLPLLLVSFAPLVAVLAAGASVNGARRWFRFSGHSIQPSELAKVLLVLAMAAILHRLGPGGIRRLGGFAGAALMAAAAAGLVAVEPDVGTAALLAAVLFAMLFAAGARLVHMAGMLLLTVPAAAYYLLTHFEHIVGRLQAWHEGGMQGKAYHAYMSLQSLQSGGLTGTGPGTGWAKLGFLPEAHNDFIFAVAGQEFGLAGTLGILLAFAILVACGIRLVRLAPDRLGALLAFGLTFLIGLQAAFNIAVVTATVPTKGISLPFVSFGGSALVCTLAAVGILLNIARVARRSAPLAAGAVEEGEALPERRAGDGDGRA